MDLNEFFGPNPNRPDNADFWRLSEIVLEMDGAIQAAPTQDAKEVVWQSYMDKYADDRAVYYLALQRSFHTLGIQTAGQAQANFDLLTKLTTVYSEGFLVGCAYQERGGKQT